MENFNPENTKPSRISRTRKRRWKLPKVADLIKSGLTDCYRLGHDLRAVSALLIDGISTPTKATIGRNYTRLFCIHQKHNHSLKSSLSILWGCVSSSPLNGWPDLAGSTNLKYTPAQRLVPMGGGLSLLKQGSPL